MIESKREFWGCQGCGRVGTSARDLLAQGCEAKPERLYPADLARELYEALGKIAEKGDQVVDGTIVVVESREAEECASIARDALARYE